MNLGEFHGYYCPFRESCKAELGGDEPQCASCTTLDEKLELAFSSILKNEKDTTMDRDMSTNDSEQTPREIKIDEVTKRIHQLLEWAYTHPKSPWVSVKERMPSVERDLFGDATRPSVLVLTASHTGGVSVNRWNGREWLYIGDVDYWMPIPKIPK